MSLIGLLVVLCVIGVAAYIAVTFLPMPHAVKTVIIAVAVICAVIYTLRAFGVHLPNPSVPKLG